VWFVDHGGGSDAPGRGGAEASRVKSSSGGMGWP
jgi:hypothetical protein